MKFILDILIKKIAIILIISFFSAWLFMGSVFVFFQEGNIADAIEINFQAKDKNYNSEILVTEKSQSALALGMLDADQEPIRLDEFNRSWSKKRWVNNLSLEIPGDVYKTEAWILTIKVGDINFSFDKGATDNWQPEKSVDMVMLEIPREVKMQGSMIGRFNAYMNWPGDNAFLFFSFKQIVINILFFVLLIAAINWLVNRAKKYFDPIVQFIDRADGKFAVMIIFIILAAGIGLRFYASTVGGNFDTESNVIIGNIFDHGGNVYVETTRYNYGPIWFWVLGILFKIFGHSLAIFKLSVVAFECLIDVGIFVLLLKKFGKFTAGIFFLNPISILISGFGGQFDNMVILLALLAASVYGDNYISGLNYKKVGGLVLLGLSLISKHIFFVFPFWLALKQKGLKEKMVALLLPVAVFVVGFLPYWQNGKYGIIRNVFGYQSLGGTPILRLLKLAFGEGAGQVIATGLFIFALILFAYIFRNKNAFESVLCYTLVLLMFSSSIATNYLTWVIIAISVFRNRYYAIYTMAGAWFLLGVMLRLPFFSQHQIPILSGYALPISFLYLGFMTLLLEEKTSEGQAKFAIFKDLTLVKI